MLRNLRFKLSGWIECSFACWIERRLMQSLCDLAAWIEPHPFPNKNQKGLSLGEASTVVAAQDFTKNVIQHNALFKQLKDKESQRNA